MYNFFTFGIYKKITNFNGCYFFPYFEKKSHWMKYGLHHSKHPTSTSPTLATNIDDPDENFAFHSCSLPYPTEKCHYAARPPSEIQTVLIHFGLHRLIHNRLLTFYSRLTLRCYLRPEITRRSRRLGNINCLLQFGVLIYCLSLGSRLRRPPSEVWRPEILKSDSRFGGYDPAVGD